MKRKKQNEISPEEKARRSQDLEDIRSVMQSAAGRRLIWRMLSDANIFRSCFTGNSQTFYLEGRREFVLPYYQDIMQACPELFWQAQQENIKIDQQEDTTNDGADTDDAGHSGHE